MKTWALFLMLVISPISFCGCVTAKLPTGPYPNSLTSSPQAKSIGFIPASDERGSSRIGTVGLGGVSIEKESVEKLMTNYLAFSLNEGLGLNIVLLSPLDAKNIAAAAARHHLDRIVAPKIKTLKISSFDATIDPANMKISMDIEVYDAMGTLVLTNAYDRSDTGQLNTSDLERSIGKLAESIIKNLASYISKDEKIRNALT